MTKPSANFLKNSYKTKEEFAAEVNRLGIDIPYSDNTSLLGSKAILHTGREIVNRLVVQPMEGFDSELDGSPSESVYRFDMVSSLPGVRGLSGLRLLLFL